MCKTIVKCWRVLPVLLLAVLSLWPASRLDASEFIREYLFDIENSRQFRLSPIRKSNVDQLEYQWEHATTPDDGAPAPTIVGPMPQENFGGISSTPAVKGRYIYFNDFSGHITKLNRFTGAVEWRKNYVSDLSAEGFSVSGSRNTPYITGDLVIVGSNLGLLDQLCEVLGVPQASPALCTEGDGAIVLALDADDGHVVWRKKVETHPSAKITGSISGIGDKLIVPVANWEEDWARGYPDISTDPIVPGSSYKCCSARGSVVALDRDSGDMLWKTYMNSGDGSKVRVVGDEIDDPGNAQVFGLAPELQAVLTPQGFYGTSAYGHNPTIDSKRRLVYVATAQNELAPKIAADCEKARRATGDPDAEIPLPAGLTCANLNQKLHNLANSMVALDLDDGEVRWQYLSRKYDAWNHACASPTFGGWAVIPPLVFPTPVANAANCSQDPVGPDVGFGHHPVLVRYVKMSDELGGGWRDLVIAGNKDGRLFAVDPDSQGDADLVWEIDTDPGGLYGGLQFGIASDGKRVYFGTVNSRNSGRDANVDFVPEDDFLDINGFTALGVRPAPYIKRDGAPIESYPAPSSIVLPFPGPNLLFGPVGYPDVYPDPDGTGAPPSFLKGPASGPAVMWTLINPPADTPVDNVHTFQDGSDITTISGMVQAVDPGRGEILWQRPAIDGVQTGDPNVPPPISPVGAQGTLTVGNGVVFIGYADGAGTLVALDGQSGEKLFQYNHLNAAGAPQGNGLGGPAVIGRWVYWGVGSETGAFFTNGQGQFVNGANRIYAFKLPFSWDDFGEYDDD